MATAGGTTRTVGALLTIGGLLVLCFQDWFPPFPGVVGTGLLMFGSMLLSSYYKPRLVNRWRFHRKRRRLPWFTGKPWGDVGTFDHFITNWKSCNSERDRLKLSKILPELPDLDRYGRKALGINEWTDAEVDRLIDHVATLAKARRCFPRDAPETETVAVRFLPLDLVVDLLRDDAE